MVRFNGIRFVSSNLETLKKQNIIVILSKNLISSVSCFCKTKLVNF